MSESLRITASSAVLAVCASFATLGTPVGTFAILRDANSQPSKGESSAPPSCPQFPSPKDVAINSALSGYTLTVKFERVLDLNHKEHASLIAVVDLKNTSGKTIKEYVGREMIMVDGIARSKRVSSYRVESGEHLETLNIDFMLDGAETSDARLRSVSLDRITGCWTTESIKFADGTQMLGTSQSTTD